MSDGAEAVIIKYDDGRMGYVQYTIQVHLAGGEAPWQIHRRFNDFLPLNDALHKAYPRFSAPLPPKRWFGRFNPDFLRERRAILQDYLDQMLSLPGVLDIKDVRRFLEVDRHVGADTGAGRTTAEGSQFHDQTPGREAEEQARVACIVDEATRALINISLPLHQVPIEQMDHAELSHQRSKILSKVQGFRDCAPHLHSVLFGSCLRAPRSGDNGGEQSVMEVLSAPARLPLALQGQLLEKQGLAVADELREASQLRSRSDEDLITQISEKSLAAAAERG